MRRRGGGGGGARAWPHRPALSAARTAEPTPALLPPPPLARPPAAALGAPLASLFEGDGKKAGALKVLASVPRSEAAFELQKRARHVASEADRVGALQAACAAQEGGEAAALREMGRLMSESHASCRDDYECSSPGLDAIVDLAAAHGALGARLTGAGWGGCAVCLVHADKAPQLIDALKTHFYKPKGVAGEDLDKALFTSAPCSGAAIYTPPSSFEI